MATVISAFNNVQAEQLFTIPATVTSVLIECFGASGGLNPFLSNGSGAVDSGITSSGGYVSGTLTVTPGDTLYVFVGGGGGGINVGHPSGSDGGKAGYNGGAVGGFDTLHAYLAGAGGGGASDIRHGGDALSNRILVAGGGGGDGGPNVHNSNNPLVIPTSPAPPYGTPSASALSSQDYYILNATSAAYGGSNAGVTGGVGGPGFNAAGTATIAGTGGRGGTQSAGGAGGIVGYTGCAAGSPGALGVGGAGAGLATNTPFAGGGGGGGGYYGGGGGSDNGGGGGAGSNFVGTGMANPLDYGIVNPGHRFFSVEMQTYLSSLRALDDTDYLYSTVWNAFISAIDVGGTFAGQDGLVLITYDMPPNAPTIATPANGAYFDHTQPLTVAWQYSSGAPYETSQSGYEIDYQIVGAGSWTAISAPTDTTNSHTFAANFFTTNTAYNIRVLNYDNFGDPSGYTTITVHAVTLPGAPTVTSPTEGQSINSTSLTFNWTVDSGAVENLWRLQIFDQNGNLAFDSGDTPSTRINLCTNPSFETATTNWFLPTGAGTGQTIASSTARAKVGTHSMKVVWGTGSAVAPSNVCIPVATIPGQTYTFSAWVTSDNLPGSGIDPNVVIGAGDPNSIGSVFAVSSPSAVTVAGTFVQISVTFVAIGASTNLCILPDGAYTFTPTPGSSYIDAVVAEQGTKAPNTATSYFDGSTANGNPGTASWTGTAGASTSLLTITNVLTTTVAWTRGSGPLTALLSYSTVASGGLYSQVTTRHATVNLSPPAVPGVVITIDDPNGAVHLAITNGTSPNVTVIQSVYRRDVTNGTPEIRLSPAVQPNSTFTDYTCASQVLYAYRVRAFSAAGGFADAT